MRASDARLRLRGPLRGRRDRVEFGTGTSAGCGVVGGAFNVQGASCAPKASSSKALRATRNGVVAEIEPGDVRETLRGLSLESGRSGTDPEPDRGSTRAWLFRERTSRDTHEEFPVSFAVHAHTQSGRDARAGPARRVARAPAATSREVYAVAEPRRASFLTFLDKRLSSGRSSG